MCLCMAYTYIFLNIKPVQSVQCCPYVWFEGWPFDTRQPSGVPLLGEGHLSHSQLCSVVCISSGRVGASWAFLCVLWCVCWCHPWFGSHLCGHLVIFFLCSPPMPDILPWLQNFNILLLHKDPRSRWLVWLGANIPLFHRSLWHVCLSGPNVELLMGHLLIIASFQSINYTWVSDSLHRIR